jgi:hypothetical protein
MFNTASIIKPKKKLLKADKVKMEDLHGIEEMRPEEEMEISEVPEKYMHKMETAKKVPETEFIKTEKVKTGSVPKADLMEMEMMLNSSKKKPMPKDENAYTKDVGYFKVEKNKEGKWKETGAAKEKYLKKLKAMKGM